MEPFFINTKCLFCNYENDQVIYPPRLNPSSFTNYTFSARRKRKREHYQIVLCKGCSLVRSNPVHDENTINSLYRSSLLIYSEEIPYVSSTYASLLTNFISIYKLNIHSLLEIGCGPGFFLEKTIDLGIPEVVGFEPSKECCRLAPEKIKGKIINDLFKPKLLDNKKYDIACLFHIIDHLKDPKETLISIKEVLNPKGYILIVCHDVESWSAKLLGSFSPIYDVEHIYLFSKKTIVMLLEKAGFEVLEIGSLFNTYPLSYWMRMLPIEKNVLRFIPKFLKDIPVSLKAGNLYLYGKKN